MPHRYDPAELDAALRAHPWRSIRRLWLLARLILLFVFLEWFGRQPWLSRRPDAVARRERRSATRFRAALVALGPTYIKIGQMLSTRPDILPRAFVNELAALQDKVPPFDTGIALEIIRSELGREATEIYAEFDVRPISAASIGQVYRAKLISGEDVVVKVQRPNLMEVMRLDLAILRRIAKWGEGRDLAKFGVPIAKDMPYVAIVDRFAQSLFDQIDFIQEAENIERFRRNFRDFPGVQAPVPYWDYTATRVLTEEYIEGFKFDDFEGIQAAGLDFVAIANLGVRSFIKQVLEDAYFHADTHPGNVLVRPNGDVVYIDFGMVDIIPESSQSILIDLFVHLVHQDFDAFISDLIALDFLPGNVDRAVILPIVEDIYSSQMGLKGRPYSLNEILERVGNVMYDYPFYLPERFAFLMRSVSSMEGVVLSHVPTYKFLEVGLPFAGKLMLNPDQRVIREKLISELMAGDELKLDRLLELFEFASREPTFRMGELLPSALTYLFSNEATRFRAALTRAALSPDVLAPGGILEQILQRVIDDPSVDLGAAVLALSTFLQTPEGLDWFEQVAPLLIHVAPSSALASVLPCLMARFLSTQAPDELLCVILPAMRTVLADRGLSLQPIVDWFLTWLGSERGRELIGRYAQLAGELSLTNRKELVYLMLSALDHPELNLAPLLAEAVDFLISPEAAPLRELGLDCYETGEFDQAFRRVASRLMVDPAMRGELLAAVGPLLSFMRSPDAGGVRSRLMSATWHRLTHFRPFL